jgi:hypothetical protein
MALCPRCGQQTEPDAEYCTECGGHVNDGHANDAWTVDNYSGAASRGIYSPTGRSVPPQRVRPWQWEPPDPAAAESERPFSYDQTGWDADALGPLDRHGPGAPARFRLPQTGITPESARPDPAGPPLPPTTMTPESGRVGPAGPPLLPATLIPESRRHAPAGHPLLPATLTPASRHLEPGTSAGRRASAAARERSHRPSRAAKSRRSGRWIALGAAAAVMLIAAGVSVLLVRHQSPASPGAQASHRPQATTSSSASPSSPATASASPPAAGGLLSVAPSAARAPREAAVVAVLNSYFGAIDSHSYGAYEKLFSPAQRSSLSAAAFRAGYGSTTDSAERLHSITVTGAGQFAALVTFTSHQQAAQSPTQSSCTAWRITLYLVKQGRRYLLTAPPPGYAASYRGC